MSTPDMATILQDLAAGRIDPTEAARRIDAISTLATDTSKTSTRTSTGTSTGTSTADSSPATGRSGAGEAADLTAAGFQPVHAGDAASSGGEESAEPVASGPVATPDDVWAAATDRPQSATVRREWVGSREPSSSDSPSAATSPGAQPPVRPRPISSTGVERISVRAVGRRVRIVAEPSVATVAADGPHVLRRNGSVLEISSDGEFGVSLDGFTLLRAPRTLEDFRSLGLGKELFLRVNPAVVVDVEVTAGSLNTEGVPLLGKVRVTAGSAKLLGVEELSDVLVQAGSATVKGSVRTGRSRIRAESGSLNLVLDDDSDVTVHGDAQLGKVTWVGGHTGAGDEVVMGTGSARLDVEVVMGHAQVRVGSERATAGAA